MMYSFGIKADKKMLWLKDAISFYSSCHNTKYSNIRIGIDLFIEDPMINNFYPRSKKNRVKIAKINDGFLGIVDGYKMYYF